MIRIQCVLLALFLFTSRCWGQPKLSISPMVAPTFSHTNYFYRYLYPESDGQVVEPVYLSGVRWATGFQAGVSVSYEYVPGWSVSSGVWYGQLTTRQARQPAAGEGTVTLRSRVIRLPLLLNYASSTKRLSPYFSFGPLIDVPLTGRVVVNRGSEPTQYLRLETIRRPIFHALLGVGARYTLNDHYTLLVQPVWTYTFGQLGSASTNDSSFEVSLRVQMAYCF
jgi:hypothetical protein